MPINRTWINARIIFVCSGNICRSPMAEYLCRTAMQQRGYHPLIISMGTLYIEGQRAAQGAIEVLKEWHIDLTPHRSQGLKPTLLHLADRVFVMEYSHKKSVLSVAPKAKVQLLGNFHPNVKEIWDPMGKPIEQCRTIRNVIQESLLHWLDTL